MRFLKILSIAVIALILGVVILHYGFADPTGAGRKIKKALTDGLADSARVELSIHSERLDFMGKAPERNLEYERRILTDKERTIITSHLKGASTRTEIYGGLLKRLCGFRPHHTLIFHAKSGKVSKVSLCFMCNSAHAHDQPRWKDWWGLNRVRAGFEEIGIDVDRDWIDLAKKHREQDIVPNP